MKTPSLILLGLVALAPLFAQSAELTPAQTRKFLGTYAGNVSGIAGNKVNPGFQIPPFRASITYTGRTTESITPLLRGLHSQARHNLYYRKPTGTTRTMNLVGIYVGRTSSGQPIYGTRTLTITDRGASVGYRYLMSLSDSLNEGTASAHRLNGTLLKAR